MHLSVDVQNNRKRKSEGAEGRNQPQSYNSEMAEGKRRVAVFIPGFSKM